MHWKIKEISGHRPTAFSSGCIQSKEGNIITEKHKVLETWTEYLGELFKDDRENKPTINKNLDGPAIQKSEVVSALK